jgi:phosphoribosyl-ATP pyrophosphohydrolase
MITITVKWLSGDVITLEVPNYIPAYKLAKRITKEPLYKVYLFHNGEKVSHVYRFPESTEVMIAIVEPPKTAIVVNMCDVEYVVPVYSKKTEEEYDKIYVDELSYYRKTPMDAEEKSMGNISYIDYCMIYRTLKSVKLAKELRITWNDFIRRFSMVVSDRMTRLFFPTLDSEVKRFALMSEKEWMSYMAVANCDIKGKIES